MKIIITRLRFGHAVDVLIPGEIPYDTCADDLDFKSERLIFSNGKNQIEVIFPALDALEINKFFKYTK